MAVLAFPASSAWAQQKSQQGDAVSYTVSGTVLDPSGAVIPSAHLALTREDGTGIGQTVTDDRGSFRFENVSSGKYRVLVQAMGFRDTKIDVSMSSRSRAEIRITMPLDTRTESVTVVSDLAPQVNTEMSGNQSSASLDRSALDRVPVFDQDYIATISRFLDNTGTGTNGVTLIVNGVEANGPGVTASAIQEVKVNQNPYSPLFARPGRARLEITTKGGTSSFHGSLNFLFRDSTFDATNAFAVVKPPEQRRYFEGSVTGPLTPGGKTTFLAALNEDFLDLQGIVHAQGVNGLIQDNVPNPTRHFFGRAGSSTISLRTINSGSDIRMSGERSKIRAWAERCCQRQARTQTFRSTKSTSASATSSRPNG
ncbi:MAG: carboxypeptidase-like regulatory domain-containing protein [Acidobacteriia bacterium]|nr:carboxypeptidase-like regulatory domain-containing protein [Terriglobia bacterium]